MSISWVRGKLVEVADTATWDVFKNKATVKVVIEKEDGSRVSRNIAVGACFRSHAEPAGHPIQYDVRPAIGDVIEIGWDYERFDGLIREYAPEPRVLIGDIPVADKTAFDLHDILRSLDPKE